MATNNRNYGTGSIRQRSANSYSIRYYGLPDSNSKRTQVEESVKGTKKAAERVLRDRLAALDTGDFVTKKTAFQIRVIMVVQQKIPTTTLRACWVVNRP